MNAMAEGATISQKMKVRIIMPPGTLLSDYPIKLLVKPMNIAKDYRSVVLKFSN
jgi:hypothetical protein